MISTPLDIQSHEIQTKRESSKKLVCKLEEIKEISAKIGGTLGTKYMSLMSLTYSLGNVNVKFLSRLCNQASYKSIEIPSVINGFRIIVRSRFITSPTTFRRISFHTILIRILENQLKNAIIIGIFYMIPHLRTYFLYNNYTWGYKYLTCTKVCPNLLAAAAKELITAGFSSEL